MIDFKLPVQFCGHLRVKFWRMHFYSQKYNSGHILSENSFRSKKKHVLSPYIMHKVVGIAVYCLKNRENHWFFDHLPPNPNLRLWQQIKASYKVNKVRQLFKYENPAYRSAISDYGISNTVIPEYFDKKWKQGRGEGFFYYGLEIK